MQTPKQQLDRARDIRTPEQFAKNMRDGMRREKLAILALQSYHKAKGFETWFKKVDKTEGSSYKPKKDKNFIVQPDYWYRNKDTIYTYEVKTSFAFASIMPVKPYSIETMLKYPVNYPNGRVLFANQTRFAIITLEQLLAYPKEPFEHFGGKVVYPVKHVDLNWHNWVEPIVKW